MWTGPATPPPRWAPGRPGSGPEPPQGGAARGCQRLSSQKLSEVAPAVPGSRPQSHLRVTPPPASPSPANQSPSPPDSASPAVSASKLHFYPRWPIPGSFTSSDFGALTATQPPGQGESGLALPSGSTQSPGRGHTHTHTQSPATACHPAGGISQRVPGADTCHQVLYLLPGNSSERVGQSACPQGTSRPAQTRL